ncbi:unnamed protein product [Mytilus edulis]|uniref:Uncharacterized protein n=1 Tax=Mytilus edulis TaxID=6550 RepID=A0A8S3R3H2_MYTED|nr:unnamed protein product [Mytilus edulis]
MLSESEAEKTDPAITKNRVCAIIRDGLRIHDVKVISAERKESRGRNPGVVVATVETSEQKEKIMKNKIKLRQTREYNIEYEPMQKLLQDTILRLEHALDRRRDVDSAFTELKNLLVTEIELTCKEQKQNIPNKRHHKNNRKPYWNEELQDLWDKACKAEKEWTSCKTNSKSTLRSIYVQRRKNFDTFNRKSKRRYQIEQQNQLHYLEGHNTKDFWKSIGKLGLANERKTQRIYQVRTENGEITNDTDTVLERWKTEYESAFNSVDSCNTYDDTFLADIKNKVRNENNYRKDIDVSGLNLEISREEVKDAVDYVDPNICTKSKMLPISGTSPPFPKAALY